MIALDEIKDFDTLKYEAVLMSLELQYSRRRLKEQAEEIAKLKGQKPAEQLELELVKKTEQLARLRHKVFGDSSERRPGPQPPGAEEAREKARGHGRTPQLRLPKREEHHRLADTERRCPACEGTLEEMGEQTEDAEEVTVEKRRFVVVTHRRHKYRCRCNGAVKTAPGPLKLIPGGRYSLDFAVALEVDKRINHLPLDRQRRQMEREGLIVSTQTMWDQEEALATLLEPSYLALLQYVLGADVIGADETHWRLMQKDASKRWWAWCLTTHDAAWYMIEPSRSAETIGGVLGSFDGVVMCDGYAGYQSLANRSGGVLRLAHCWAHVRRKFYELRITYPQESKEALDLIDGLFLLEREMPAPYDLEGDTKEAALEIRRLRRGVESRRQITALRAWAERQTALPRSSLAEAIRYMLDHWTGLTLFLDDPMVDLDNNGTERALRGMVLGRKNHYGSRSLRGTQVAAIFYSLIETCILCDIDPEAYLRFAARKALGEPGAAVLPQDYARELNLAG